MGIAAYKEIEAKRCEVRSMQILFYFKRIYFEMFNVWLASKKSKIKCN